MLLYFNLDGDGDFQEPIQPQFGLGGTAVTSMAAAELGDSNGPSYPDIALALTDPLTNESEIMILENDGFSTLTPSASFDAGYGASDLISADLDGDGDLDLAVADSVESANGLVPNNVSVLLNDGKADFAMEDTINPVVSQAAPTNSVPLYLTIAGFNDDGKPDLAVAVSLEALPVVAVLINTTEDFGEQPPAGGGPGERVLVSDKGKELCLPEAALNGHLKHGDQMIGEEGCSNTDRGSLEGSK